MIEKNSFIFDYEEIETKDALKRAMKIVSEKTGIVRFIVRTLYYNDEPKMFHYTARMCDSSIFSSVKNTENFPGGASFNEEKALMKTLGEAIERYCLGIYQEKKLIETSYKDLKENILNPKNVVCFSRQQLKNKKFGIFRFDENTIFKWVMGYSISKNKKVLIPAQLVYVPYRFKNEPLLRFPISTGAACGTSLSAAIYRGICEVVERDAFIINYLNSLPREMIDTTDTKNESIKMILKIYKFYNIDVSVFDITTDIPIPTFLAVLIDRSGIGPAVTLGLKTSLNPEDAFLGSIEEAQPIRFWMRDLLKTNPNVEDIRKRRHHIKTFEERGLLWASKSMIRHLNFLLKNEKRKKIEDFKNMASNNSIKDLKTVLKIFQDKKMQILFVDITTRDIEQIGFKVVKVIIPEMQPFYFEEDFKYLGGERLYSVPEQIGYKRKNESSLNQIPHPFL